MSDRIRAFFEANNDEFLRFEKVEKPRHPRPDVCAFLILSALDSGTRDIIGAAGHDEIWLGVDPEIIAAAATDDDLLTLIRCGIRYDASVESFAMFV